MTTHLPFSTRWFRVFRPSRYRLASVTRKFVSLGLAPYNPSILGVVPNFTHDAYVNQRNIQNMTRGVTGGTASLGTMIARVAAHEVIQHSIKGVPQEGFANDVTRAGMTSRELAAPFTTRFNLSVSSAGLCPP